MSLGLTYNNDLSRVQITITGIPGGIETVTVERSVNELLWETVRGAAALPVSGGTASVDDFEFAADVDNYYRVSSSVEAGLHLPGVAGSYASTPNHASLHVAGGLRVRTQVHPDVWASGAVQTITGRYGTTGNQRSWQLVIQPDGLLRVNASADGTATTVAHAAPVATTAEFVGVNLVVNNGAGGHSTQFSTAPARSGPWGALGSPVPGAGTFTLHGGTEPLTVGAANGGAMNPLAGVVGWVEVYDVAAAAVVADADFAGQATGATAWADSTGKPWAVHGAAEIIGDPLFSASITPSLEGRVWLKSIRHPFLNRPVSVGGVTGDTRSSKGGLLQVQGRSAPIAVTDVRASQQFTVTLRTATLIEARDMDLTLASGDTFYLQVPAGSQIPGGYVAIDTTGLERFGPVSTRRRWPLPCTVVTPPGPGVVGTTLTWGGVFNLYGSWAALDASNPTWRDLLATVGSPDDLVVL